MIRCALYCLHRPLGLSQSADKQAITLKNNLKPRQYERQRHNLYKCLFAKGTRPFNALPMPDFIRGWFMERSVKVNSRGGWGPYIGDNRIRSDATD